MGENQLRVRGIEDIDLMVTAHATIPAPGDGGVAEQLAAGDAILASLPLPSNAMQPSEAFTFAEPSTGMNVGGMQQVQPLPQQQQIQQHGTSPDMNMNLMPISNPQSGGALVGPPNVARCASAPGLCPGRRLPASPCRAVGNDRSSRMDLQMLLRRTQQESGEMQLFIQKQYRFLRQETASRPSGMDSRDIGPLPVHAMGLHNMAAPLRTASWNDAGRLGLPFGVGFPGGYFSGEDAPSSPSTDSHEGAHLDVGPRFVTGEPQLPLEALQALSSDGSLPPSDSTV